MHLYCAYLHIGKHLCTALQRHVRWFVGATTAGAQGDDTLSFEKLKAALNARHSRFILSPI
jgi:hypothetical protein